MTLYFQKAKPLQHCILTFVLITSHLALQLSEAIMSLMPALCTLYILELSLACIVVRCHLVYSIPCHISHMWKGWNTMYYV